ncbi:MAG: CsiV family protein [Glaciecola sp.]|jgi:hypothetical protein
MTANEGLRVTKNQCIFILLIWMLSISVPTYAQDNTDWWFDVEVLIFKHNNAPLTVTEQFDDVVDTPASDYINNIFEPFHFVDISWLEQGLPECEPFAMYIGCRMPLTLDDLVARNQPIDRFENMPALPIHYDGYVMQRSESAHMLPKAQLQLTSLYNDIKWDEAYTPLLHTIWRQPVAVGQENAFSVPLLAGKNLTYLSSSTPDIEPIPTLDDLDNRSALEQFRLVPSIVQKLDQLTLINGVPSAETELPLYPDQILQVQDQAIIDTESVFELEGLLTIFIKYINRVPYLHIDSHALFHTSHEEDDQVVIKPHTFKQRRRIISNQIHYFDHPYFGIIVTLTRHKRPALPEENNNENLYSNR